MKNFTDQIYVTAGSKEKCDQCLQLGAKVAINYKEEDFEQYFIDQKIKVDVITFLSNLNLQLGEIKESKETPKKIFTAESKKIPRNSPCPCGSGKKYKHCCGAL